MRRRPLLGAFAAALAAPGLAHGQANPAQGVSHRLLRFPADHGAHPDTHIEWWYVTGWLRAASPAAPPEAPPGFGFQVTFFRVRTGLAESSASQFAARQVVIAHTAFTDLAAGRHGGDLRHDQRAARDGFGLAATPAPAGEQTVRVGDWSMTRAARPGDTAPTALGIDIASDQYALRLQLGGTQPRLLQGEAGYSQKGPDPRQASHYYSEPQLAAQGRVERAGQPPLEVAGRAWLDHEWSNELLPAEAVGWDWVGFNLHDGAALTAFRLRRADGSALWAGGSFRDAGGVLRVFRADEVVFTPGRRWRSPRTQAEYPVEWQLRTPAGAFRIRALQDDQELDSRASTGSLYWEGVSALEREEGHAAGWGYLELTGYGGRLRL